MEKLSSFYNSLFAVEFAVLSILLAGIFLFLQIIYQDKLFKFIKGVSWTKLIVIALFCLASLSLSGLGALFSSFPNHNFVPAYNFNSQSYISCPWFGLIALLFFLVSTILAICIAIGEILSLRPAGLMNRALENIKSKTLQKYLIKQYGLQEPFLFELNIKFPRKNGETLKSQGEEEKIFKNDLKFYQEIVSDTGKGIDPFEPIGELAIRSIRDRDTSLLANGLKALGEILKRDIYVQERPNSKWNPNTELFGNLVDYSLKWVSFLIEECKKEGISRLWSQVYDFTNEIAALAVKKMDSSAARKVISYWKIEADKILTNDTRTFIQLIGFLSGLGKIIFPDQDNTTKHEILNDVFRSLGWLGERLLEKSGVETKPLMYDEDYETSYDALFNAIMEFESDYKNHHPKSYPLIYFDAIGVVFNGLMTELERNRSEVTRSKISRHIFDFMYAYSSFAIAAIDAENGDGASLATLRLIQGYDELRENAADESLLDKNARDAIGLVVDVAFHAAGQPLKNTRAEFLSEGIEERLLKILSDVPTAYAKVLDSEIMEGYLHSYNHKYPNALKSFIKRLGAARGTNFGLNLN
jgi:hypothetical protein